MVWEQQYCDKRQHVYFYNNSTGKVSWDRPAGFRPNPPPSPPPPQAASTSSSLNTRLGRHPSVKASGRKKRQINEDNDDNGDGEVDDDNGDDGFTLSQEAGHDNEDQEKQKEARTRHSKSNTICSKCHRNKMQFTFCDISCKDVEPGKTTYQDIEGQCWLHQQGLTSKFKTYHPIANKDRKADEKRQTDLAKETAKEKAADEKAKDKAKRRRYLPIWYCLSSSHVN